MIAKRHFHSYLYPSELSFPLFQGWTNIIKSRFLSKESSLFLTCKLATVSLHFGDSNDTVKGTELFLEHLLF